MSRRLRSQAWQGLGVALAFLLVAALHRHKDGLWFPDAPLHAANGLFWWDFITAFPVHPVEYALSYYARYPIIRPAAYPPLFYLLEGLAFAIAGPSPHVAKIIVLAFAIVAGLYTMAWARRWIGPAAGWAGLFLAFLPALVVWGNAVMLNVPAMALGLASLYHVRAWLETASRKHLLLGAACFTALVLTYYPGASVVCVYAAWAVFSRRTLRLDRRVLWIGAGALVALVPLLAALVLGPVHTSRHIPSMAFLTSPSTWTYYWRALPDVVGMTALVLGAAGCVAAFLHPPLRTEATYLALWIVALVAGVTPVPAMDPRYILLVAPAFILAAALGIAAAVRSLPSLRPSRQAVALVAGAASAFWLATRVEVPHVTGFREVATYLEEHAPRDAVLYDGSYGALFGFYVRASDPQFERRVVAANHLLYAYGPGETFAWTQKTFAASADDVVTLLKTRSGCRWVAIAVEPRPSWLVGRRLLREAVARPEFELVRSFPTSGAGGRRVDLYRIVAEVDPIAAVDLQFSALSRREFRQVVPVTR